MGRIWIAGNVLRKQDLFGSDTRRADKMERLNHERIRQNGKVKPGKDKTTEAFYWVWKPGKEVLMWSRHHKESSP